MTRDELLRGMAGRLRLVIEAQQKLPAQIAREFGVRPTTMSHWTTGRNFPDPLFLVRFANAYRVNLDFLYRGPVAIEQAMRTGGIPRAAWTASVAASWGPADPERAIETS